jgi:hypothetical protein
MCKALGSIPQHQKSALKSKHFWYEKKEEIQVVEQGRHEMFSL